MTSFTKQIWVVGGLAMLTVSMGGVFLPSAVYAQGGGQSVPVTDEDHIEVSEEANNILSNIQETNKENLEQNANAAETLKKLLEVFTVDHPEGEKASKDALAEKSKTNIDDSVEGYKGYMNNQYLPQYDCEEGENSFIETDPDQYYQDVSNSQFNRFLVEEFSFDRDDLCDNGDNYTPPNSNDTPNYQKGLVRSLQTSNAQEQEFDLNYNLHETTDGNVDEFMSGDFSHGGYAGLFSALGNSDNHIYGAYTKSKGESERREREAQEIESQKLEWSGGAHALTNSDNQILTPGTLNRDRYDRAVNFCERSLVGLDKHQEVAEQLDEHCQEIENKIMDGLALDGSLLDSFDQLINGLINLDYEAEFENIIDDLESEAEDYVSDVIDDFIGGWLGGGGGGGFL
ncbi:MAG: hypothetical protein WDZ82_03385 [Candidatus Paceibacterota bacterium]